MKIYITVGLPGCGKSTWRRKMNLPVVSSDDIRSQIYGVQYQLQVEEYIWKIAFMMIKLLLDANIDFIIDSTNLNRIYRKELLSYIRTRSKKAKLIGVIFPTSISQAISRDAKRVKGFVGKTVIKKFESDYHDFFADPSLWLKEFDQIIMIK